MADNFDERLDQVERALKIINGIDGNAELQTRAFDLLFGGAATKPADLKGGSTTVSPDPASLENIEPEKPEKPAAPKRTRKVASVAHDKTLDIAPTGKTTWTDFVAEKQPSNMHERYTACVYWVLEVAELPTATINQVVTLFIAAKWTLPKNPRNQASQTSREGYIDSKDQSNLKLTSTGSALVLNGLPPKKTA